ncbi:MAG: OB-fold nucleic acid binding domain-containing protein, partial [Dehalococcoidia bacterium]
MASPVEGLRRILALEQEKKFADSAVVGGLDSYLLHFLQDNEITTDHDLSRVMQALPPGGYRALHRIQRKRVVAELIRIAVDGVPTVISVQRPPIEIPQKRPATGPKVQVRSPVVSPALKAVTGSLRSPLRALGVRKGDEERFRRLRMPVETVHDLLYYFPRDYHDYSEARKISELIFGEEQTVIGMVRVSGQRAIGRQRRKATEVIINDSSGTLRVLWWNQPWIAQRFRPGMKVALSGKVTEFRGTLQMDGPEIEPVDEELLASRRRVPIYSSTEGLSQLTIRDAVKAALDSFADALPDAIPPEMCDRLGLSAIGEAIRQVHFPESIEAERAAVSRFAFEELLYIEVGVVRRRREWQKAGAAPRLALPEEALRGYVDSLPFRLTGSQERAIGEVLKDAANDVPMTRLLEGDVGSGKTAVAAAALLSAVVSGYQGA